MTRRCRPLAQATFRFVPRCCPATTPMALHRFVRCSTSTRRALTFAREADGRHVATADVMGVVFDESGAPTTGRTARFHRCQKPTRCGRRAGGRGRLLDGGARRSGRGVAGALRRPRPEPPARWALLASSSRSRNSRKARSRCPASCLAKRASPSLTPDEETAAVARISSPALRVFSPGARLVYTYEIYNAVAPVDTRVTVWRDGRPYFSAPPSTLTAPAKGAAHDGRRRHQARRAHATRRLRVPGVRHHAARRARQTWKTRRGGRASRCARTREPVNPRERCEAECNL